MGAMMAAWLALAWPARCLSSVAVMLVLLLAGTPKMMQAQTQNAMPSATSGSSSTLSLNAGAASAPQPSWASLRLTDAERAWAAANPLLRVGLPSEFPPYYFSVGKSRYDGFVIDLTERLAERIGVRLKYTSYASHGDTIDAVRRGEVDLVPFTSESPERRQYLAFARPLFSAQMVYVANRALTDVSVDANFSNYRVVVEKDTGGEDVMRGRFPKANLKVFDNADAAILAVASGDADIFVGYRQVAVYYMEKHLTANLAVRGSISTLSTALGPAVRKDLVLLASMLDKANADLGSEEINAVAAKWLPRSLLTGAPRANAMLSDAQRAWIKNHGSLRLGFDSSFAPIAFANIAGGFDGLAADITRAVAGKVGLILGLEEGGSFSGVYERALKGELDLVVAAARNPDRTRDFDFVGPFLSVPTVVVASVDRDFSNGLGAPGARSVAVLRQHFLMPLLRSRYPRLLIKEFNTQAEVLNAVRAGQADLAIGNLKVVNQLLESQHVGALHSVGSVPQGDSELYFAVRKALPELSLVLRAGLDAVTPAEMVDLQNRWLRTEFTTGVPWARVVAGGAAALGVASLIIGTLWFSNRRQRQARHALQQAHLLAEEQVQARSSFVAYLSHELRGTLGGLNGGLGLLQASGLPQARREQLTQAMQASAKGLLDLCERTLDFERALHGGVDLHNAPVVLVEVLDAALAPWRVQAEIKGLALHAQHDFWLPSRIECDAVRVTQVLQNLVGNAVKFSQQGVVTVKSQLLEADDQLVAGLGPQPALGVGPHKVLVIEVADTGPGVPPAEQSRLFEPFVQGAAGRRSRRGAGLGLSISARIVQAAAGQLVLAQSSPAGSRFVLRMPVALVPDAPARQAAQSVTA
jgi:two-component system, NarL family, sensor histidine kinase EvgS